MPTVFWSFWEKTFRYGPTRISYDRAVCRLAHGFQLTLGDEICTFTGQSWSLGNQDISISDFKDILINSKLDSLQPTPPNFGRSTIPTLLRQTPIQPQNLFVWKFESKEIEPRRVKILTLCVTSAGARLVWVSEETLHQHCKDLLLEFWERGGGRDATIVGDSGYIAGDVFTAYCIIQHRERRKRRQYLVEWVGYREHSWIKEQDICYSLVEDYWKRMKGD